MPPHSPYAYHRLVVGYHGCDRSVVEAVLLNGGALTPSNNRYDWLGSGVYFWEQGRQRALEFAREQQARGKVKEPAVLGAYIHLGRCFDLTDTWATAELAPYHDLLVDAVAAVGGKMPINRPAASDDHDLLLRDLDCAVLNLCLKELDDGFGGGGVYYQTVRGVFQEGAPIYPGARIYTKTHVQIAVRDASCILGYFVPTSSDAPS